VRAGVTVVAGHHTARHNHQRHLAGTSNENVREVAARHPGVELDPGKRGVDRLSGPHHPGTGGVTRRPRSLGQHFRRRRGERGYEMERQSAQSRLGQADPHGIVGIVHADQHRQSRMDCHPDLPIIQCGRCDTRRRPGEPSRRRVRLGDGGSLVPMSMDHIPATRCRLVRHLPAGVAPSTSHAAPSSVTVQSPDRAGTFGARAL
jgi:hypothetical protein